MRDWVQASLDGDIEEAARLQGLVRHETELGFKAHGFSTTPEDHLPDKRVPARPCPGFDRLDTIMSIEPDQEPRNLAEYKPIWSGTWAQVMGNANQELF